MSNYDRGSGKRLFRIMAKFSATDRQLVLGWLDGAMGDTGSIITPFYDSLLVKITVSGSNLAQALDRMSRALREMRIRGVKTNIPFLENVITHKDFVSGNATTRMIDVTPSLFKFKPRKDRASKLLSYLGEVIVNGNPQVKGRARVSNPLPLINPQFDTTQSVPEGTRTCCFLWGLLSFPNGFARRSR